MVNHCMSSDEIEKSAVLAVKYAFMQTSKLSASINENDKEPSWDGFIYMYETSERKKDGIKRVPVQVKGKREGKQNKRKIKYQIQIADLDNYYTDDGAIFFVVLINPKTKHTKIYYTSLLPKKIESLKNRSQAKKKISVSLYEFPNNPDEIQEIFNDFIREKSRQKIITGDERIDVNKLLVEGKLNDIFLDINRPFKNPVEAINYILDKNEIYLYARADQEGVLLPYQYFDDIEGMEISTPINGDVIIDDNTYYQRYDSIHSKKSIVLNIGKSFKVHFNKCSDAKSGVPRLNLVKFDYNLAGNLKDRIKDIKFILALLKSSEMIISGVSLKFNIPSKKFNNSFIEEHEKTLDFYIEVCDTLRILNVERELELDSICEDDIRNMVILIRGIKRREVISNLKNNIPIITIMKISNVEIALIFRKTTDEGSYQIEDFFGSHLDCRRQNDAGIYYNTTQFAVLNEGNIGIISNINYQYVQDDIMSQELSKILIEDVINLFLVMVNWYDNVKDENYYDFAMKLLGWIKGSNSSFDIERTIIVNELQMAKRKRSLTFEEKQLLHEMFNKIKGDSQIKELEKIRLIICIYILLDEKTLAQDIIENLGYEEKINVQRLPIMYFIK